MAEFPAAALAEAVARQNSGDLAGAQAVYWRILLDDPAQFDALHLLGVSKCQQGHLAEGAWFIARAIQTRDEASARYNLGKAYYDLHRERDAMVQFDRAVELNPAHAMAWSSRGDSLQTEKRYRDAIASYERALQANPTLAGTVSNMGAALVAVGEADRAMACFHKALAAGASRPDVLLHIGKLHLERGEIAQACTAFDEACQLSPDWAQAHWFRTTAPIPAVAGSEAEVDASRAAFRDGLAAMDAWYAADPAGKRDRLDHDWPFYLAYQARDNRDLMARTGQSRARWVADWASRRGLPAMAPNRRGKVRVAVLSGHLYSHSVWHALVRGWFRHFDRARIELHGMLTGRQNDSEVALARSLCASFESGIRSTEEWARSILALGPEVLIYPSVGMEGLSANLAAMRLAPVQLTSWGHPETSGLPTVDGYISAAAFESPGSEAYYTERLIVLPRFGAAYRKVVDAVAAPELPALGLDPDRPLLLCPGSPFKYAPEADAALVAVARAVPEGQLVFFHAQNNSPMAHRLRDRLAARFAAEGVDFDRAVTFLPFQRLAVFHGLIARADLVLDTIGFSGFNIAMQVLANGTPMVAFEGQFMRGRLASGILRTMGLHELIATSHAEFAAIAARLIADPDWRRDMRQRIAAGLPAIYDDAETVGVLQDAIEGMALAARRNAANTASSTV